MFTAQDFVTCVQDNLKARNFGHKRIKELTDDYKATVSAYEAQGRTTVDAGTLAMKDLFENMTRETQERLKRTTAMLAVQADNMSRIAQADNVSTSTFLMDGKRGSKGVAVARAAVSLIEDDPRFNGLSYSGRKETIRGELYAIFNDVLEKVGKGAFGMQKGKANLPNIIREIKGEATGDAAARDFARAWQKIQDYTVDLFEQAGGSMRRLNNYIPQSQNAVKMHRAGVDRWTSVHMKALDWDAMRWPDGKPIPPAEREAVLRQVYETLTTDGAAKIDPTKFRGRGRAVGNMLENHRFLHYKDAQAWLDVHKEFGDGNVFDTFVRHIEEMSHRIALVETFGPNPEMTALNVASIVRKRAGELGPKELRDAEAVMKNKFEPMLETVMRQNPMDPESVSGNLIVGAANILTSAQLGSASFLAIPGDFMQTAAVRALNNMGLFDGVGFYVKSLASDPKFMRQIATQSGFVMDEVVMSTYSSTRFTGLATHGPAVTRRISEATMRLSLLSGHTRAARWATQAEFMGLMNRMRDTAYEDLPFQRVMDRYGITKDEWDALRHNVGTWNPRKDVSFMRPIDILQTNVPNKQLLYRKFQGMIMEESRRMVPEATIEAATMMKGTTRPDTLPGALLHSFSMYKNFPVSFAMIYGRLGMTARTVKGRLAFYAGLGAGMTMVGALGTQMREVSRGRDPLPMDNAAFIGKAFLSGGALSIWGDFLFNGINEYGSGPQDVAAGPIIGFLGDTTDLLLGDVFQWADTIGTLGDGFESQTAAKAVEWARRYTPGASIWWARLALERQVFDRLQNIADPNAYQKRRQRTQKQLRDRGQTNWWAPGQSTPDRLPQVF